MATKTKKITVTCTAHEEAKLKRVGYLNANEACNYIWSGRMNFPTEITNVQKVIRYVKTHASHCIKHPSATYVNAYRRNHTDMNNPKGQMPEGNYQITADVIQAMKIKFLSK
jgi:hypothetical protein